AIGEQVAKIAGAVWIHNLHSTGEEKMAIQTPEGRIITTSLKPSDVCDLICAFMYPAMRTAHGDKWKLATTAEFDMWLNNDGMLTDYGITKWQMLVSHIANAIDHVGYGDAKH
ncbi:hypothetical protein QU870_25705, partial [Escherichia coli]|nr:hypothetical protein [Escherichia coli]